jgi:hypothetical protein
MLALKAIMPYAYTPVVLIGLSGILIVLGGLMGPETRDVELHAVDSGLLDAAPSAGD